MAERFQRNLTPDLQAELAASLGLPQSVLACLIIGFDPHKECWTFPEADGSGRVVGISRRFRNKSKGFTPGGQRGLTVPAGWNERAGAILCPEGPSCALAISAMNLPAIGRPSNRGGVEQMAELFKAVPDREIIVVGDFDPKPDSGEWPGKAGAIESAEKLAAMLSRSISWALPPDRCKDTRAWVIKQRLDPGIADAYHDAGEKYQAWINQTKKQVAAATHASLPEPIPFSQLRAEDFSGTRLWDRYIHAGCVTLLSSIPKVGKTTLLSHLLRAFEHGDDFCDRAVTPGRVLVISEEGVNQWLERGHALGFKDHLEFICRPFTAKPSNRQWKETLDKVAQRVGEKDFQLVIFDTLGSLWPVTDECNASEVQAALMPLHAITAAGAGIVITHHLRKSGGDEGIGARGSSALPGFVDAVVELKRHAPKDTTCRKRILAGFARWDIPPEVVIEWDPTAGRYVAMGSRNEAKMAEAKAIIRGLLPRERPGLTRDEIKGAWPGDESIRTTDLGLALNQGADEGLWIRDGLGRRNSPFTFWIQEE